MEYSLEEKEKRFRFVLDLMVEQRDQLISDFRSSGIGEDLIDRAGEEVTIDEEKLGAAIQYYFEVLMVEFKNKHKFEKDELANRDKMCAFMALAVLTLRPFRSLTGQTNFDETRQFNEQLALRYAFVVLEIDAQNCGRMGGDSVPDVVMRNLEYNLRCLGEVARERMRKGDPIKSTDLLMEWVIQAMQMLGLAYGSLKLHPGELTLLDG